MFFSSRRTCSLTFELLYTYVLGTKNFLFSGTRKLITVFEENRRVPY
jgi:hypothetical protein